MTALSNNLKLEIYLNSNSQASGVLVLDDGYSLEPDFLKVNFEFEAD